MDSNTLAQSATTSNTDDQERWFPVALVGIMLIYLLVGLRYLNSAAPSLGVTLCVLVIGPLCLWLWLSHVWRQRLDLLEPINVVWALLALLFWGNLLLAPGLSEMSFAADEKALIVTAWASLAFLVGYRLPGACDWARALPLPRLLRAPVGNSAIVWLLGLWLFTLAFRFEFLLRRGYGSAVLSPDAQGSFGSIIVLISSLGPYMLYMALVLLLRRGARSRPWMGVIMLAFLADVGVTAAAGWKSAPIALLVGVLLVIRSLNRDPRKVLAVGALAGVVALPMLLFTFQVVDIYRQQASGQGVSIETLGTAFKQFTSGGSQEGVRRFYERVAYGTFLSNAVGAVDKGVVEQQGGGTLWPALVWFVPRSTWPDKPVMSIGGWFAVHALGWDPGGGEAAVTVPGDFYLNFGIPGVVIGMLLYGLGLRFAYEYLAVRAGAPAGMWVYLPVILGYGLGFEKNFAAITGQVMQTMLVILVLTWVLQKAVPQRAQASEQTQ